MAIWSAQFNRTVDRTDMESTVLRPNLSHLPEDLRGGRWCLWRYEKIKDKIRKKPKQVSGVDLRTTRPEQCCTFEEAVAAYAAGKHRFDGIGRVLGDGLFAVDLDGCLDGDGVLAPHAAEIVDRFDSYTEITPSGTGLRIIFTLNDPSLLPANSIIHSSINGRPHSEIKVMARGYVTVTGRTLDGMPAAIAVADEALIWLLAKKAAKTKSGGGGRSRSHKETAPDTEPIPAVNDERAKKLNRDISRMLRWDPVFRESWHQRSINAKAGLTLSDFGVALVKHAVARNQDWDVSDVRYLINKWSRCENLEHQHDSRVKSWFASGLINREVYVKKLLAKLLTSAPRLVDVSNPPQPSPNCVYTPYSHTLKSLNLNSSLRTRLNLDALNSALLDIKPRKPGRSRSCTCDNCKMCKARIRQQKSRHKRDYYHLNALYQRHLKFGMDMDYWKAGYGDSTYGPDPTYRDWLEWIRFEVTDEGMDAYKEDLDLAEFIARETAKQAAAEKRRWERHWDAHLHLGLLLRPLIAMKRPSLSPQAALDAAMNLVSQNLDIENGLGHRPSARELVDVISRRTKLKEPTAKKHAPESSPAEISANALMGTLMELYFLDERFSFLRDALRKIPHRQRKP